MKFLLNEKSRRHLARFGALVVVVFAMCMPLIARAAESDGGGDVNSILNNINVYVNILLRTLSSIFWPVLLMIGSLLDTSLIFGGPMEERLLSAWVEIRNLVNIIFVLILVAIAIYNVLGLGNDGGPLPLGYKAIMPKFVIALILVNFSFVGVKMVLDLSNVITGAVFALPAKTIAAGGPVAEMEAAICGKRAKEVAVYDLWCDSQRKFNAKARQYFNQLDRNNISVVYAIRYGKATELKFIREGVKDLGQLGFNIIFNTILFTVYTIAFIALFLVLATRLVVIWLALVMSPLFALTMVLPNLSQLAGGAGDIKDKLIGSIIAPITIGLTLSVGYIMLDALSASSSIDPLLSSSSLTAIDSNALPTNITTLQQLLIAIGSIVVVWTGVKGAADKTFASGIVGSLMSQVADFGKWIGKLPLYAQVIPVGAKGGKDGKASIRDVQKTIGELQYGLESRSQSLLAGDKASPADITAARSALNSSGLAGLSRVFKEFPNTLRDSQVWKDLRNLLLKSRDPEDQRKAKLLTEEAPQDKDIQQLAGLLHESKDAHVIAAIKDMRGADINETARNLLAAVQNRSKEPEPTSADGMLDVINSGDGATALNSKFMSGLGRRKDEYLNIMKRLKTDGAPELQKVFTQVDESTHQIMESGFDGLTQSNVTALVNFYKAVKEMPVEKVPTEGAAALAKARADGIKDDNVLSKALATVPSGVSTAMKGLINPASAAPASAQPTP